MKKALIKFAGGIFPAEWIFLTGLLVALVISAIGNYEFYRPVLDKGFFASMGKVMAYTSLYALSFLCLIIVRLVLYKARYRTIIKDILPHLRLLLCLTLSGYLMLTFKWWAYNDAELWDQFLNESDQKFYWLVEFFKAVADWLKISPLLYYEIFSYVFFFIYFYTAVMSPHYFRRIVTVTIGVMIIGGIGYMLMPAYGPFVYFAVEDISASQHMMRDATDLYRSKNYMLAEDVNYAMVLGAMPSLHVAFSLVFMFYAWKVNKLMGLFYIPAFAFIFVYASITGFHYIMDLFGGIIVAALAVMATELLHKKEGIKLINDPSRGL